MIPYIQLKRFIDITLSALILGVLAPVIIVIAIGVRLDLGTPILFRQRRPGYRCRPFTLYKFRTMRGEQDEKGNPLPDNVRLTRFGKFLRITSLDELPELWNVIRGDMSLVGPRPLLQKYLPYYTTEEQIRFEVRPGITGLAQINGRNKVSWNERLALDVDYVKNMSLKLDIQILFRTLLDVFRGSGVIVDPRSAMKDLDEERGGNIGGFNLPADTSR